MEIRKLKKDEIYAYDMNTHEVSIVSMLGIDTDGNKLYKFGTKIVPIKRKEIEEEIGSAYVIYGHDSVANVSCLLYDYFVSNDYVEGEIPIFFSKQNLIHFDNFVKKNRPFYNDNRSVYEITCFFDSSSNEVHNYHVCMKSCDVKNINPKKSFCYNTVDDAKNAIRFLVEKILESYNKELKTEISAVENNECLLKQLRQQIVIAKKFKAGHSYVVFPEGAYCKGCQRLSFKVQSIDKDGIVHLTDGKVYFSKQYKYSFIVDVTNGIELQDDELFELCYKIEQMKYSLIRDRNYVKQLTKVIEETNNYDVENLFNETFRVRYKEEISDILKKYNKHIQ